MGSPAPRRLRAGQGSVCREHAVAAEIGDKLVAPETLQGLACVAEARGEAERAARLFGASEALREVMGAPPEPGE